MKLLLNSVDALTQGDDLVSIRSKEPVPRMMEGKISAGDKTFYRTFVIAGSPLLFSALVSSVCCAAVSAVNSG